MNRDTSKPGAAVYTHSSLSAYQRCPRLYGWKYELGLRPDRKVTALRLGAAFHDAIDFIKTVGCLDTAILAVLGNYANMPTYLDDEIAWAVEREIVLALVSGWWHRWQDPGFEVIESELEFQIPLDPTGKSGDHILAGKIDGIVRLDDGRLAILEHKTTASPIDPGSDYRARLRVDRQISLYMLAARQLGWNVDTVIYDMVRKPSIRPKNLSVLIRDRCKRFGKYHGLPVTYPPVRETPEMFGARLQDDVLKRPGHYFQRMEVPRLDEELDELRHELQQLHRSIDLDRRAGIWPRNTASCLSPRCQFRNLCFAGTRPEDIDGQAPEGFCVVRNVHPELENLE